MISSCAQYVSHEGAYSKSIAKDSKGFDKKAVASISRAETIVGGFSDADRAFYRRGIQHILNVHRKPGSYTIGEVVWDEQSREHAGAYGPSAAAVNYCDRADTYERQAVADDTAGERRSAYNNAVSGLKANDQCTDESEHLVNEGYLLSLKGLAEHYLSEGDSRTDLNQANMLLVQCQTKPGLYGTSEGAGCETQEQNNIHAQTTWDIYQ